MSQHPAVPPPPPQESRATRGAETRRGRADQQLAALPPRPPDGLAVAGMCCGIAGLVLAAGTLLVGSMLAGLVTVLALAVSAVGLFLAWLTPSRDWMRITGLALNGCGLALGLLSVLLVAIAAAQAARQMNDMGSMLEGLRGLNGLDF